MSVPHPHRRWNPLRPSRVFRTWQLQLVEYCIAAELLVAAHDLHHGQQVVCLVAGVLLVATGLSTSGPVGLSRHPRREHMWSIPTTLIALALVVSPAVDRHHLTIVGVLAPVVGGIVLLRIAPFTRIKQIAADQGASPSPRSARAEHTATFSRKAGATVANAQRELSTVAHRGALRGAHWLGRAVGARSKKRRAAP